MTNSPAKPRLVAVFLELLRNQSGGGILLMAIAALAMVIANSPLAPAYFAVLNSYIGPLSVLHWVNDALMAVFFLLVGLEIKRELIAGELSTWPQRALPGIAALGGMIAPALLYWFINRAAPASVQGWAIPCATDIAFTLAVVRLLGPRVPMALIVFLTALAILDDLGAVVLIAAFYTAGLSLAWLGGALAVTALLVILNLRRIDHAAPYVVLGIVLWVCMFKSGVHATIAGVVLAMCVPIRGAPADEGHTLLYRLEHGLQPWVAYVVIPVFGIANAGVSLAGVSLASLAAPVPLGVALGLFIGKQAGIMTAVGLAVGTGLARLPAGATWGQLYGAALLCGIGFTMSLFIGLLAFSDPAMQDQVKIGVLVGSISAAVLGALVLRACLPRAQSIGNNQ